MFALRPLLLWLALFLGMADLLCAEGEVATGNVPEAESTPVVPVLRDYRSFWNIPDALREQPHRMDFEALVLYYDPDWQILWMENEGAHFFLKATTPSAWPIRTGDRVRVEGMVVRANGDVVDGLRLTRITAGSLPAPVPFDGCADPTELGSRRVRVRGVVDLSAEIDPRHLRLWLAVAGVAVEGNVLLGEGEPVPQYDGAVVEVDGLLSFAHDSTGQISALTLWVAGASALRVVGSLATEPEFDSAQPFSLEMLQRPPSSPVRVSGHVRAVAPGRTLTLWDDSSEIVVHSAQSRPVAEGAAVEAVGRLEVEGMELHLRRALWRLAGAQEVSVPQLKLRRAVQVLELAPEEASLQRPVELTGVVTWGSPTESCFYLQDATRGVRILSPDSWRGEFPQAGDLLHLDGRTMMGRYAPQVRLDSFRRLNGFTLPEPREVTLEQLRGGAEEARLVEVHGYLRGMHTDGSWTRFSFMSPSGEFIARMPRDPDLALTVGAVVRIRGICTAVANARRQLEGIELLVGGRRDIEEVEAAAVDPFAVPLTRLSELRRFNPLQTPYRRVRTVGRVNYQDQDGSLLIEDGADGLEVALRGPSAVAIGTRGEVAGFPGTAGGNLVLREAVVRPTADASPAPRPWTIMAGLRPELHNRLVLVHGDLVDAVRVGAAWQLTLRADEETFPVMIAAAGMDQPPREESGLEVAGVYRLISDEYGRQRGFKILARTPGDIVVVRAASWFTRGRLLGAVVLLLVGGAAVFAWSVLLRRRVAAQTRLIRRQLEQQSSLERELEKAAKLESLGLLAGGIAHDFNNLLTVILGNLTLARLDPAVEAAAGECLQDAEKGTQRARDLTQQLLTFAKGGDPHRTAVSLPEVVREAAEFVLRGSKVAGCFDFAPALRPADADRGQVGQVVHNLVLNAIQAMPGGGEVRLSLENAEIAGESALPLTTGHYLVLAIADSGPGMDEAVRARIFDPYFSTKKAGNGLGLATVHSIVRRHRGHIAVVSAPGRGTIFRIWLPASAGAPAAAPAPAPHALPPVVAGKRVLVMDDEEDIRRLMTTLLQRMGLEVVVTADGAETVAAFREERAAGHPFDLVITDLTVPGGMGGRAAMEALRAIDPEVRAIVASGYSTDPVLADHRAFGFRARVCKPFNIEELADAVARVLAGEILG